MAVTIKSEAARHAGSYCQAGGPALDGPDDVAAAFRY
jgi:hypothetical protein